MKYNFGSTDIVTCYLKEVLHNFNLPSIPVYTDNTVLLKDRVYIKDNKIIKYLGEGKFKDLAIYSYNKPIVNITRNLIINSSEYDEYTHRYLGDYLRFLRDFNKVNLMGMYNCFGNEKPSRIEYSVDIERDYTTQINKHFSPLLDSEGNILYEKDSEGNYVLDSEGNKIIIPAEVDSEGNIIFNNETGGESSANIKFEINTENTGFDYYIVPVKFNQTYTVALTSDSKYELACILYNKVFISDMSDDLVKQSYKCINGSRFNTPLIYETFFECADDLWKKEKDLCLLIKLPEGTSTSIVVLEGNYTACSNIVDETFINKYVYDHDNLPSLYFSKNSLLKLDDKNSYPFADRLVEYILENAITNNDKISDNIERVQNIIYANKPLDGYFGIWDNKLRDNIYKETLKQDITKGDTAKYGNIIYTIEEDSEGNYMYDSEGNLLWSPTERTPKRFIDIYNDLTGYVDKDVESLLRLL